MRRTTVKPYDVTRAVFVMIVLFGGLQVLYIMSQNNIGVRLLADLPLEWPDDLHKSEVPLVLRHGQIQSQMKSQIKAKVVVPMTSGRHEERERRVPPLRQQHEEFLQSPYRPLVYGTPRPNKGYLTIGIPSVMRPNSDRIYLFDTLDSLIQNTDATERNITTIVVMLSDSNTTYNKAIAEQVYNTYTLFCDSGFIQVIIPSKDIYPNLDKVRKTYNDGPLRLKWRAKQNVDYSYLFMYSVNISSYYMQLEDDVVAASGFFSDISNFVKAQGKRKWFLLEFSFLGFIGKLFHSEDLVNTARYLLTYFDAMPCDLLLGKLRIARGQSSALHTKKSLFQHLGKFSSLENKMMPTIDMHFKDADSPLVKQVINSWPKGDNPPASIRTSFLCVKNSNALSAYDNNVTSYLWVHTPTRGDYFQLQFTRPWNFSRIVIITGDVTKKMDSLAGGNLLYSRSLVMNAKSSSQTRVTCGTFRPLASLISGELDTRAMGTAIPTNITCLKILLTKRNRTWLILREIILIL